MIATRVRGWIAGAMAMACVVTAQDTNFVPFVIPPDLQPGLLWTEPVEAIAVDSPRLVVEDGHFSRGGARVRLWGVNLSFGANLPAEEDAPRVARRLAALGINSVRMHHMDTAWFPRGIWDRGDGKALDPEALLRLDTFIDELAAQGILVNLNLHVGRDHSRYLGLPGTGTRMDKMVGIFVPELVEAQKTYARDLLTRVNTRRGVRYADDPAVAIVEISNEDSLFMWDADRTLSALPAFYAQILARRYNTWLKHRYGSTTRLATAWEVGTEPLGEQMLTNGSFAAAEPGGTPVAWTLEQHAGCEAAAFPTSYLGRACVRVSIRKSDDTSWHLQINQRGIRVGQGRYYTLRFTAAAEAPRPFYCNIGQAHEPWRMLGLGRSQGLTPAWQTFEYGFAATADDDNARVNFAFSGDPNAVYLADVEFLPGGRRGLQAGESLDAMTVNLFGSGESDARINDRYQFLAETEKAYFDEMRRHVKDELGCRALVTGTVVFGPLGLYAQRDMDFIDAHAYWQHPRFPGRPWDRNNWTVEQVAMVDRELAGSTLPNLALSRLAGKPFTVTEYNHPAPIDYQAECVPVISGFAAAQDWDGVWIYSYNHANDDWDRDHYQSFFDIRANPAKLGFLPAGAAVFRGGDMDPLSSEASMVCPAPAGSVDAALTALHRRFDRDMLSAARSAGGVEADDVFQRVWAWRFDCAEEPGTTAERAAGVTRFQWPRTGEGRGAFMQSSGNAFAFAGHACDAATVTGGRLLFDRPSFAAVTLTPLGSATRTEKMSFLVTACGRAENMDMGFSADRRTLGTDWGRGPVGIEPVGGRLRLPPGRWRAQALGPDGTPGAVAEVKQEGDVPCLTLSPELGTMWYRLEVGRPRSLNGTGATGSSCARQCSSVQPCPGGTAASRSADDTEVVPPA